MSVFAQRLRLLFGSEAAPGLVLGLATVAALVVRNSPWGAGYDALVAVPLGPSVLHEPLSFWINDLWMGVFFFLVGLEIKRELLVGELATWHGALLPACAALGGMVVPAAVYLSVNAGHPAALRGWAIPCATDIAFALGIVLLLGPRVPAALRVFLTAVAIIDDLLAIVVIAVFYTDRVALPMLGLAALLIVALAALNRARVLRLWPYVLVGAVLWAVVLAAGVHPTLAGVAAALAVPLRAAPGVPSPLLRAEHGLRPWVAWLVLPVFAFVNAGVSLHGLSLATLREPVPLGIAAGLLLGKPIGVLGTSWLLVRHAGARLPSGASPVQFAGVGLLCGVGFTMSLFIGGLAFPTAAADNLVKIGVLGGSLLAGVAGTLTLVYGKGDVPAAARE